MLRDIPHDVLGIICMHCPSVPPLMRGVSTAMRDAVDDWLLHVHYYMRIESLLSVSPISYAMTPRMRHRHVLRMHASAVRVAAGVATDRYRYQCAACGSALRQVAVCSNCSCDGEAWYDLLEPF